MMAYYWYQIPTKGFRMKKGRKKWSKPIFTDDYAVVIKHPTVRWTTNNSVPIQWEAE